jgi:hypothetical protein
MGRHRGFRPSELWLPALGALALVGCASKAPPESGSAAAPGPDASEVARFLPLADQTVLSYETKDEGTGERGTIILQVRRPKPASVELNDGGRVTRLELGPEGVRHTTGGYWLKAPLEIGACWQGKSGKTCISGRGRAVSVPAGRFSDCLETAEQAASGSRVTTVFCPGVGMTLLDVESDAGGRYERVEARLRSYGPRVDIDHLPPELAHPPPVDR